MLEGIISFIISVIVWSPVWIPLALVTSPIWGLAVFGMFSQPIHDIEDDNE